MAEQDEFGEFVNIGGNDEFGEFVSLSEGQKKSPSSTTGTNSTTPSQQPTTPSVQSGSGWTNASTQDSGLTPPVQQKRYDPRDWDIYRAEETKKLKEKATQKTDVIRADAKQLKQDVNAVEFATQYPEYKQLQQIDEQIKALGEPKSKEQIAAYNDLVSKRNALLETDVSGRDVFKESAPNIEVKQPTDFETAGDYAAYQQGLQKQFQDFTKQKEKFEAAKPRYEGATKLKDVIGIADKSQANALALTEKIKTDQKEADKSINAARELNKDKLEKLGFGAGFMEGMEQTTLANTVADIYLTGDDDQLMKSLENIYEDALVFPKETTTAGGVGELLGGQVKPIAVGAAAGALSPAAGFTAGTLYYGRLGAGGSLIDAYTTARSQGMTAPEALDIAKKQARVGGVAGAAEGALGMLTLGGKPLASLATMPFKKAVTTALADNGVDAVVAGMSQYVQNKNLQRLGIDVDDTRGVADEMGAELLFGAGMNLAAYGGSKIKGYGTIINGIAKLPFQDIQAQVDNAVKAGVLDEAKAQAFTTDVIKSKAAQDKLKGVTIPEDVEDSVIDKQKQIDALENDKENASPAVLPAIEGQIETKSKEIAEELGTPLNNKEQKEYEKLVAKRDATDSEGKKTPLLESEKKAIEHYEKRLKSAETFGKNEANKIAADLGFDNATHLLNKIKKEGLGEFEKVQDVPADIIEQLKNKEDATQKISEQESVSTERESGSESRETNQTGSSDSIQREAAGAEEGEVAKLTTDEAVRFIDDHAIQTKIDRYAQRPDFGLSSVDLERGIRHIKSGKTDTVAAKKILSKIQQWKQQGFVDVITGAGGLTGKLTMPFELPAGSIAEVDSYIEKLNSKSDNLFGVVKENYTTAEGSLDREKLSTDLADLAKGEYWGDLLGLDAEELVILQDLLKNNGEQSTTRTESLSNKGESNSLGKQGQETVAETETNPTEEVTQTVAEEAAETPAQETAETPEQQQAEMEAGAEQPLAQPADYKPVTEPITMPDGEEGVKLSIQKPDGETVEVGNFYPEDVEAEFAKRVRGFKLQDSKGKPTETIETTEATIQTEDATGKSVTFDFAGAERVGVVQSIDEQGNYKVKGKDGTNYTVKPENARSTELVEAAKKSFEDNLKKIDSIIKTPAKKNVAPPPKEAAIVPKEVVTAPMKALGMADKVAEKFAERLDDAVAKTYRKGIESSNKFISFAAGQLQGLFKQLGLTQADMEARRKGLGKMNVAPLKAVKFYQNAVDAVGRSPESLRNVHQVLDPEVYEKRGETLIAYDQLTPEEKNLYDLLRATNDMIHDWHFANGRISEETYLKNKGTYAPRFYDNIEFEGLPTELKEAFEDYSKTQNFSYVKERQNFEDVMGENTVTEDPAYGTAMRLAQMLRNQAMLDYASEVNSKVKTYNERDENIPRGYVKLEGGGQFGNIKIYGDLTNKYVPRDYAEDFKGATFINSMADSFYQAFRRYDRTAIRQILKKSKTLYNPITQLGNIGSNYVFAMMNGIDPLTFQKNKVEAAQEVKNKGDLFVKLVEEGLLGTDITTRDLKEEAGPKGEPKKGIRALASAIDDKISDFYGSRDDIAKIAAYLSHTKDYGRTEAEAIKRVSEGFQNYNNVGRFYDFASKTPVIGNPFVKFKGDLLRIMKNNFAKRPLTNIALLGLFKLIADGFSELSDEDENVKAARERRPFIPKIPLPNAVGGDIPLVWKTPIGEVNAARYFSPLNIYDMGDKTSVVEEITQFLPYQLNDFEGASTKIPDFADPFLGVYTQLAFDKDFRGKPIVDPEKTKFREGNATADEKALNAAIFIARQQIPFFSNADDMRRAIEEKPDYYGRNRDLKQALLSNALKVQDFDAPEAVESLKKEIEMRMRDMDKLNDQMRDAKSVAGKNIKKINEGSASSESKQKQVKDEYIRAQNKIAELLEKQAQIKQKLVEPAELLKKIKR